VNVSDLECPWCSAELPTAVATCPSCGAALTPTPTAQAGIPGLTEVPPELLRYAREARTNKKRPSLLTMIFSGPDGPTAQDTPPLGDADALRPPSAAVKAEMDRIEYENAVSALASGADTDPFAEIEPAQSVEPIAAEPTVAEPPAPESAAGPEARA
jgi:hypothetical protein